MKSEVLIAFSILIQLLQVARPVNSAQILGLFIHPGKSHFDFYRPLLLGLAKEGHNVTVISYFPNKIPVTNYTDYQLSGMPIFVDIVDLKVFDDKPEIIPFKVMEYFMLHEWGMQSCEIAFNSDSIQQVLKSSIKYDVILVEQFNNDCMMAVAHTLGAPIISLSSCALMPWHYDRMGTPFIPSFMPLNILPYHDKMNFLARVNNFIHYHLVKALYNYNTQPETNKLIRKHFGSSIPPVEELIKKTSLMLTNQHFSFMGSYPRAPNIIEVEGLQIQEAQPLPTKLEKLLKDSVNGVVYFSWGSMIRPETLPDDKRNVILNVIAQMPEYTFLMKWSNDSLAEKPNNLHTLSWMPQREVLCHPNVKAFITHGGKLGTSEGTYCGVPMLVTPFYGDQFLNAMAVERRQLGIIVPYYDFKTATVLNALKTILSPKYSQTAKLVSDSFSNRPQPPLCLAIWWVEHIIRTKGQSLLDSASKEMNTFIYNSLDIYVALFVAIGIFYYIVRFLVKTILFIWTTTKSMKQKQL